MLSVLHLIFLTRCINSGMSKSVKVLEYVMKIGKEMEKR